MLYVTALVQQASERIMDHTELLAMSTPKVRKLIQILKSYLPKVSNRWSLKQNVTPHKISLSPCWYSYFGLWSMLPTKLTVAWPPGLIAWPQHAGRASQNVDFIAFLCWNSPIEDVNIWPSFFICMSEIFFKLQHCLNYINRLQRRGSVGKIFIWQNISGTNDVTYEVVWQRIGCTKLFFAKCLFIYSLSGRFWDNISYPVSK